jgi:anti-anti-sigma factor
MAIEQAAGNGGPETWAEETLHIDAGTPLLITESQMQDRHLIVLSGELDLATAPALRERLVAFNEEPTTDLVLDIGLLTFIDSTGLSLMVSQHKALAARGAQLTIYDPTPMTRRLLDISGLTPLLHIIPERDPTI